MLVISGQSFFAYYGEMENANVLLYKNWKFFLILIFTTLGHEWMFISDWYVIDLCSQLYF